MTIQLTARAEASAVSQVASSRHHWRMRVVVAGLLVAVLAAEVVIVGPYAGRAARALSHPNLWWLLGAILTEVLSLAAFAHLRRRMLSAGGTRIPLRRMLVVTYAANAVSLTLPAGTALSVGYTFRRLRRWGASVPLASFTLLASGVLSSVSFGLLGLAGALMAGAHHSNPVVLGAGVLTAVGVGVLVRRLSHRPDAAVGVAERGLRRANRLLRRDPESGLSHVRQFVSDLTQIKPRHRDWAAGLLFAGLNWITDLLCLIASGRAVGMHGASISLVLVAYVAGMSVSSFSLLPGGLGVTDAAMIFALSQGGPSIASATAAVLLYRVISLVFNAAAGWVLCAVTWRLEYRSVRAPSRGEEAAVDGLSVDAATPRTWRRGDQARPRLLPDRKPVRELAGHIASHRT